MSLLLIAQSPLGMALRTRKVFDYYYTSSATITQLL